MLLETGYIDFATINGNEALVSNDAPLPVEYVDECGPVGIIKQINLEDKQIIISLSYPYQVIGPDDFGFDSYDQVDEFLNQALGTFESMPE